MRRGMTLLEVLLATSVLIAVLAAASSLLLGLARNREAIVAQADVLRTMDVALDRMDRAFTTVSVRAGSHSGLVITEDSLTLWPAMERPGIETPVPGRHKLTLGHDGVGITLKGGAGDGVQVPGLSTLRVRARHEGQWVDAFDAKAAGTLPSMVVVDAWLQADPEEDTPPDRRRVFVVVDAEAAS